MYFRRHSHVSTLEPRSHRIAPLILVLAICLPGVVFLFPKISPFLLFAAVIAAFAGIAAAFYWPAAFLVLPIFAPQFKSLPGLGSVQSHVDLTLLSLCCAALAISLHSILGSQRDQLTPSRFSGSAKQITAFFAFAIIVAGSYLYTPAPEYGGVKLARLLLIGGFFLLAPLYLIRKEEDFRHFALTFVLFGILQSFLLFARVGHVSATPEDADVTVIGMLGFMGGVFALQGTRSSAATNFMIISWHQPAPEWDKQLHVSVIRAGCSDQPQSCLRLAKSIGHGGKKVFLSMLLKAPTATAYGVEYGQASRGDKSLLGIGLDDFVGQYERLHLNGTPDPAGTLNSLIDGIKSNPNLGFGLTIYEDDLASPYLADQDFPAASRAKVDYVHFYIHYRVDTPKTADYVNQIKTIFPNAKIILGVYPYDRISYLPCAKGASVPCTPEQELDYVRQGLDIDLDLAKNGTAVGIEFYPGIFGNESDWKGWDGSRICPGRKDECVANTEKMHQVVLQEFQKNL